MRRLGRGILGVLGLLLIIGVVVCWQQAGSKPFDLGGVNELTIDPVSTEPIGLTADIGYTGMDFIVLNGDTFDWVNVKMEVNPGVFSDGYVLRAERIAAGTAYTVEVWRFSTPSGEAYNPLNYEPMSFSIWCEAMGRRGYYYGTWEP